MYHSDGLCIGKREKAVKKTLWKINKIWVAYDCNQIGLNRVEGKDRKRWDIIPQSSIEWDLARME